MPGENLGKCQFFGMLPRIAKEIEKYDLMWSEEPVPKGMIQPMKRVAEHVNIPIALGKRLNSKTELKQYLESEIVDIMMFDCGKIGT